MRGEAFTFWDLVRLVLHIFLYIKARYCKQRNLAWIMVQTLNILTTRCKRKQDSVGVSRIIWRQISDQVVAIFQLFAAGIPFRKRVRTLQNSGTGYRFRGHIYAKN